MNGHSWTLTSQSMLQNLCVRYSAVK